MPITDPDSLKLLPNGDLLLTGEADGAFIFIKDPGTAHQSESFVTLPAGDVPDDAVMPTSTSGTFYISNQGANDIVQASVTGLKTGDLYADIASTGDLVQIDPKTGAVTTILSGLNSPHGLLFIPSAKSTEPSKPAPAPEPKHAPVLESQHILAVAPAGDTAPDSVTIGAGSTWVEYGNTADSAGGGGTSVVIRYGALGQVENSYTIDGEADGLKYNPTTGDVWVLINQDGNAKLQVIDPRTDQVSGPMTYGSGYVYGSNSTHGFDDVVFDGKRVFLSETNPANPGDPVIVQLLNGNAPFGTLETQGILSYGDTGTNLVTGQTNQPLPVSDPDSLKLLSNGDLLLTGGADGAYIFVKDPGTSHQSASFVTLPAGYSPDDAIMPTSTSGTFTIANTGTLNDVVQVKVSHLNTSDLYADITSKNELVQIDPRTGTITPIVTGLSSPHGLAFTPAAAATSHDGDTLSALIGKIGSSVGNDLTATGIAHVESLFTDISKLVIGAAGLTDLSQVAHLLTLPRHS